MIEGNIDPIFDIPLDQLPDILDQVLRRQADHAVGLERGLPGDGCDRILLDQDASQFIMCIF